MAEYDWDYRCSICDDLVSPDDIGKHTREHKEAPGWQGWISWTRVDKP